MTYCVGIDLGSTQAAAVVVRHVRIGAIPRGEPLVTVPSIVYMGPDGHVYTGQPAVELGASDPGRVVHAFKQRVGDATPMVVGGRPISAHLLLAHQLRAVLEQVIDHEGSHPAALALSHPAVWGPHEVDLLRRAVHLSGLDEARIVYLTEPEAVVIDSANDRREPSTPRLSPGDLVMVYDFGGGSFDATLVRLTGPASTEIIGRPRRIGHLGGMDIDALVIDHVDRELGGAISALDLTDDEATASLRRIHADCARSKELLSGVDEAIIPIVLGGRTEHVRLTRPTLNALIGPAVEQTVETLRELLPAAGIAPSQLDAVILAGGSSQLPAVADMVRGAFGASSSRSSEVTIDPQRVVVAPDPALTAARGAAIVGAQWISGESPDQQPRPVPMTLGSSLDGPPTLPDTGASPPTSWPPPPPPPPPPGPVGPPTPPTPVSLDDGPVEQRRSRRRRTRMLVTMISTAAVVAGTIAVAAAALMRDDSPGEDENAQPPPTDPAGVDDQPGPLPDVSDHGDAWLSVYLMGGLAKIDMQSREVVANVPINGADSALVTRPSRPMVTDDTVWMATRDRQEGPTVYLVDRDTATIRHRVPLGITTNSELEPVNVVRTHEGAWATFAASGGAAVAVLLDGDGQPVTTVDLELLATAEPVSDGTSLLAVDAAGALARVDPDGSVDTLELDGALGGVALGDGVIYGLRASAVDHIDAAAMDVEASFELTRDGRPFELNVTDGFPRLAAIAASGSRLAFSTFDADAIINVVSLDAAAGNVETLDELPIGGASASALPQGSASDVGPDGELWVDVQQSVVRIEDGESEMFQIDNPVDGASPTQDMAVVADGVARTDTDDQGYPAVTTIDRDEREVSEKLPLLSRTIAPMYEAERFWLFGALRGPAVPFDAARQQLLGAPVEFDGISAGPTEVAGQVWMLTFATNDPNDPDDDGRQLLVLDPDDGSVVDRRPFPYDGALMSDGDDVWISGDDFVKIDPITLDELARVEASGYVVTPIGYAFGMGIPDDIGHGAIWNLSTSGLRRIDSRSLDVTETSIPGQMFSVTVAGEWVWVSTVEGTMYRIDPATGEMAGSVDVGDELIEIAMAGSTHFAVEIDGGNVHRLRIDDGGADEVVSSIDVGFGPVTWKAHQGFLWVANEVTGRVHQIDQQGKITKTLLLDGRPSVIASDGGDHLVIGLQDRRAVSVIGVGIGDELAEVPLQ